MDFILYVFAWFVFLISLVGMLGPILVCVVCIPKALFELKESYQYGFGEFLYSIAAIVFGLAFHLFFFMAFYLINDWAFGVIG